MQPFAFLSDLKGILLCAVLTCIIYFAPNGSYAQGNNGDVTSGGTEFLLCFMANEAPDYGSSPELRYQDIYLASAGDSATVTITCKMFPKWRHIIHLTADQGISYRLSTDPVIGYPQADALIETSDVIDSTVFHVISTTPITCYGMSHKQFTCDAFLALPHNVASTEYIVMSYSNSTILGGSANMPSEFCVASFDDDDTVMIIPTAITKSGYPQGEAITYVLNAGDAVQIQGNPDIALGDLTGSIVRSTKPVVVYGGSQRTEVPTGFININGSTSRDHLSEAIPPLSAWGQTFITKNFGRPMGDLMRIVASEDNTTIKINGTVWGSPFQAREYRDTLIEQSASATDNIFIVEASNPILTGMIAHTADQTTEIGDPFLAIMPPIDQTYHDYTYFISNDSTNFNVNTHYIIIATEVSGAGAITIDGNSVPKQAYTKVPMLIGGKQYAVVTVAQSPGIHRIISPNADENGFIILAYGFGDVDSYGYTAGALLKPFTGILDVANPGNSDGKISVRNILAEKIYLDSSQISYSQNPGNLKVSLKNNITVNPGAIDMGESKDLALNVTSELTSIVKGTVRIFYHTQKWNDLKAVDFSFTINSQAGVGNPSAQNSMLESYPNPAVGKISVRFSIPSRAYASVKIYDALGRVVRIVTQGVINSGDQNIQVSTSGLIPGNYTLELAAPELGINEHRKMIIIE